MLFYNKTSTSTYIATADKISPSGQYICPMKCEGEKIYNEPGRCPVCGMFLAPIEEVNTPVKEEKFHVVVADTTTMQKKLK